MNGEILSIETAEKIAKLEKENEKLKEKLNCKELYSTYMPDNVEFVILTKKDYERIESDYKTKNEKTIDYLNGILTEAYLDESNDVDIALVEYAVSLLLGEKQGVVTNEN